MKLTKLIVEAAITRMELALTGLSVTRALGMHANPLISGRQAGAWIDHGKEAAARGHTSDEDDLDEHTRLCLRLYEADNKTTGDALMRVGRAKARILDSEDPKVAGAQVTLIRHLDQALAPELFTPRAIVRHEQPVTSTVAFTQDQLDLLSRDELESLDRMTEQRAELADAMIALVRGAEQRRAATPATVH